MSEATTQAPTVAETMTEATAQVPTAAGKNWSSLAVLAVIVFVVIMVAAACAFAWSQASFNAKLQKQSHGVEALPLEMAWPIFVASAFVAIATVVVVVAWRTVVLAESMKNFEAFWKVGAPLVALGYFLYQMVAGAQFATTSVSLTAERDCADPKLLLVKLSVERGTQWMADIASDAVVLHVEEDPWTATAPRWKKAGLPRRADGSAHLPLRLAPGEKTATEFKVESVSVSEFYVTARVVSFASYWPVPSESLARVRVGAVKKDAGCSKSPAA